MRGIVKLFFFALFVAVALSVEYYCYMQYQAPNQVALALKQFDNNHQTATEVRTGLWFLSADTIHLIVIGSLLFVGLVVFWTEIVAVATWLFSSKDSSEGEKH
jgi:hypothetical protein